MEMWMSALLPPLVGGLLIGVASWLMLAALGRVTGISGILSALLVREQGSAWRLAFVFGLMGGGWVFATLMKVPVTELRSPILLMVAGLLVGFGTVWGSGCTSGHGVCGLARFSLRSVVAVVAFMVSGMIVAVVTR